ncbi:hypothetical protein L218DRAFT_860660, partial [Marasmius fiardii PR-910]
RLDSQFWFYQKHLGCDLVIRPEVVIPDSGAVLDAGTGSGVWILALSKEVPQTVSLHAIDLDPLLFRRDLAPHDVNYSVCSVTAMPEDWTDKFDLVNQRLLFGGLSLSTWPTNLAEIYRITKPGGSIQLVEFSSAHKAYSFGASRSESPARKFDEGCKIFIERLGFL